MRVYASRYSRLKKKMVTECDAKDKVVSYGHLRGSYECLIKAAEYWHIDHGYMGSMKRSFEINKLTGAKNTILPSPNTKEFDSGYFRISHNAFFTLELEIYQAIDFLN